MLRDDLLNAIVDANSKIKVGHANKGLAEETSKRITEITIEQNRLAEMINHLNAMYKEITTYVNTVEKRNLEELNMVIQKSATIVPDAKLADARISYDGVSANIVTDKNRVISVREGSGVKAIMSTLMRCVLIANRPGAIKFIIFDEAFNTLSQNSTNDMREVLHLLSDKFGFVFIEQHPIICEGLEKTTYRFVKKDDVTHVIKE